MTTHSVGALLVACICASRSSAQYAQGFNCGSASRLTTPDGCQFDPDREYDLGNRSGRIGGETRENELEETDDMGGIVDPVQSKEMLRSWAEGMSEYRFDVPSGRYLVSMHFMESEHHWSGLRRFDVEAEGRQLIDDLDIFLEVDRRFAMNIRRGVTVADGTLNLEFADDIGVPCIEAIHVERFDNDQLAPPTPTGLSIVPSYSENILSWDESCERDELGVWIWREDMTAYTPEELVNPHPSASSTRDSSRATTTVTGSPPSIFGETRVSSRLLGAQRPSRPPSLLCRFTSSS